MAFKKTKLAVLVGLSLAASVSSAAPGTGWTGLYGGIQAGYAWGKDETANTVLFDWTGEHDIDGWKGGVFGGYNHQMGNWVLGFELDAELSDVKGSDTTWEFGDSINAKITSQGSARLRVGYAFDHTLLYATGGVAFGNIKTNYIDCGEGCVSDDYSQMRSGWTLGAGVEYAFAPKWTARLDYRYVEFRRVFNWTPNTDGCCGMNNDLTEHAVRVGIGRSF